MIILQFKKSADILADFHFKLGNVHEICLIWPVAGKLTAFSFQKLRSLIIFNWHQCRITVLLRFRSSNKSHLNYIKLVTLSINTSNSSLTCSHFSKIYAASFSKWRFTDDLHILLKLSPSPTCPTSLKIQISNPVDKIEEAKGGWEEYSGVGVDFGDMDMHSVLTPSSGATIIKAAEETGAVFPVQTFIRIIIIIVMVGSNIVQLQQRRSWSDVNRAGFLQRGTARSQTPHC